MQDVFRVLEKSESGTLLGLLTNKNMSRQPSPTSNNELASFSS